MSVNGTEARHRVITLGKPEQLKRPQLAQETARHSIVWFDDHRQHHPCCAFVLG